MRCTSVVVQYHTLPSQTFFEPVITQIQLSNSLLEVGVLFTKVHHLITVGFANNVTSQPFLTGFQKVFAPAVIQIAVDAFPTAQFGDRQLTSKFIQNNADLLPG